MSQKHAHALIGVVNICTCYMYVQKEGQLSTQDKIDSPLSKSMLTNMKSGAAMVVQPLVVWSTDSLQYMYTCTSISPAAGREVLQFHSEDTKSIVYCLECIKTISEGLKFKTFLRKHAPDPPWDTLCKVC